MQIITEPITLNGLQILANHLFENMVKAVVDVDKELLAVDAELHSDLEALLLESGSRQKALWGINLYPALPGDDFIEFDSMINLKPSLGNRTRGVEDPSVRLRIVNIVKKWVKT
ncbi:MAG: hypothetical protein A2036_04205 [Omnitrophica bacterium GWA2_50_21]|nr:MAG: hypothetical protein A2036_04205 [Omnitrophica bacterium GWA2_50_21]